MLLRFDLFNRVLRYMIVYRDLPGIHEVGSLICFWGTLRLP